MTKCSSEKCLTFTSAVFSPICQITDLYLYVLISTDFNRFTGNPAATGSSPCCSQKLFRAFAKADETEGFLPSFNFFGIVRLFLSFFTLKGPFSFFFIFCNKLDFQKAQRVPPFPFFGTMRLFRRSRFRLKLGSQYIPTNSFFWNRRNIFS